MPLAGPPRCAAHQPARSRRARALLLGRPRSSPHKERRLSIRVNLAGPRANTIGRVFTNEVSLRLRRHHPLTLSCSAFPAFLVKTGNRDPLKMCVLHSSVARSKNKASTLTISTERLCLLDQSLLHERVCVPLWKLSSLSLQSPEEVRGTIGPTVLCRS